MPRKTKHLNVWMNGLLVGQWTHNHGRETFQYAQEWIESSQGRPLSLSLPFLPGNNEHKSDAVKFYFDNLLPDSTEIRSRLASKFKTYSNSAFDLLVELGKDCVGAIQLLKPDETPDNIKSIQSESLTEAQIARILRSSVSNKGLGQLDSEELRISLAGAQEKSALLWHNGEWCKPNGSTPTTHILKLPLGLVGGMQADMHSSVENEWLCSKILHEFQIPVAHCDIGRFEDQKALIVKRFDRKLSSDGTWIIRLPQEDFCQAKGIAPHLKYQSDGGPSFLDCAAVLSNANNPTRDKMVLFSAQILFWALHAPDGHAKNFSIRHLAGGSYELTELYDVLSAFPIIGKGANQLAKQDAKVAMAVRGSKNYYKFNQITKKRFIKQGKDCGLHEDDVEKAIHNIGAQAENVVDNIYTTLPEDFPIDLAKKILDGMIKQIRKL